MQAFDGGGWEFVENMDGNAPHVERYFLESGESGPDVRLYINGNFGGADDARAYGEKLAALLNGSP